jgi:hypothetical protein
MMRECACRGRDQFAPGTSQGPLTDSNRRPPPYHRSLPCGGVASRCFEGVTVDLNCCWDYVAQRADTACVHIWSHAMGGGEGVWTESARITFFKQSVTSTLLETIP